MRSTGRRSQTQMDVGNTQSEALRIRLKQERGRFLAGRQAALQEDGQCPAETCIFCEKCRGN